VPIERVTRDVEPERLLLARERLAQIPRLDHRVVVEPHLALGRDRGEQADLGAVALLARAARALERPVDAGERARAGDPARLQARVERAALHERLEHALVDAPRVDALG